jgi:Ca2+-transporting ATPase
MPDHTSQPQGHHDDASPRETDGQPVAYHALSVAEVVERLETSRQGLTATEARRRLEVHGYNELVDTGGRGPLAILWEQLYSAMVLLLVAAAVVSLWLGEHVDAGAIVAIILLNAALGFYQDYRAEKALAALRQLSVPTVKVRRDGQPAEISAKELVPGDLIVLESGNLVPADCRVVESANLRIDEASLTGESEPVDKSDAAIEIEQLELGDRTNMAYRGTLVAYGHGLVVVVQTGMETELGKIARSLQTVEREPTPLQTRLAQLGRTLAIVSLAIVAVVFVLGVALGESPRLMLLTALSLAVAIVPEGLPAVATVALALGARRMFKRAALIRKLSAVETLGSVTVICSDKTGTLTENRMAVKVLEVAGCRVELNEHGQPDGELDDPSALLLLLSGAALCNDAELVDDADQGMHALGEPTEAALVVAAARMGLPKPQLDQRFRRIGEVPFDSMRKRMTTLHRVESNSAPAEESTPLGVVLRRLAGVGHVAFMKGAVDAVLESCQSILTGSQDATLDQQRRERVLAANDELAASGMRVLGVAFRRVSSPPEKSSSEELERDHTLLGLVAMMDPPRPEVREAVARCRDAGVRPIMITGDHPLTALHIAQQLGITEGDRAVVGRELANMTPEELEPVVQEVSVFARVAPSDKLHIVQALQNRRQIVAMTGDGVNDAPALKQAHIGVAMGQIGTDVSKEASDMVLMDDNFATIVNAVEEGRIVYDNIRKFVKYTMTSNAGEVAVMVLGPLLGMPLPLLPLQILWINLVTDGLPGLALAVEPAERDTMRRPPYPPHEHIMGHGMWRDIVWVGLLMGATSLVMGYFRWTTGAEAESHWRTIVFTVLTLAQMGNAMAIRSNRDSLFRIGVFSNRAMLGAVSLTFGLQMAVVYLPSLQRVFHTTALSIGELIACIALSSVVFWAIEAKKLLTRRRLATKRPAETE